MNQLKLKFTATECRGWPRLKFYIDDDLYEEYHFIETLGEVVLPIYLENGPHELVIELFGKTQENTVFVDGQFLQDQLVTLDEICIDEIPVPNFIKYSGQYHVGETSRPSALTWGQNGRWVLQFQTPIITWVVDQKHQRNAYAESGEVLIDAATQEKKRQQLYWLSELEKSLRK